MKLDVFVVEDATGMQGQTLLSCDFRCGILLLLFMEDNASLPQTSICWLYFPQRVMKPNRLVKSTYHYKTSFNNNSFDSWSMMLNMHVPDVDINYLVMSLIASCNVIPPTKITKVWSSVAPTRLILLMRSSNKVELKHPKSLIRPTIVLLNWDISSSKSSSSSFILEVIDAILVEVGSLME